jgi:Fe-S oxidoreductase
MSLKDVFFVQLYGPMQPVNAEPFSVEVLAGALQAEISTIGFKIFTISYLDSNEKWNLLFNAIDAADPLYIGVSIPQSTYDLSIKLVDKLLAHKPNIQIVLGNSLPTYTPEVFLNLFPQLFIVRGWGEEGLVAFTRMLQGEDLSISQVPNLAYTVNGELQLNPITLPRKWYRPARIPLDNFYPRIESSRGCAHNICTFCTRPLGMENLKAPWIRRDITETLDEISYLHRAGVRRFTFADEDFIGTDIDGAQQIANELKRLASFRFTVSVRADSIHDHRRSLAENQKRYHLFKTLRDAGADLIYVGAESFSDTQLKRYGKGLTAKDNLKALGILQNLGLNYEIGFILFDQLTTIQEIKENIAALDQTGIWGRVGHLLDFLRPQKASGYARLLISSELAGDFDIDSLSYIGRYANSSASMIAQFCNTWESDIDLIHRICRNLERTTDSHAVYTRFMMELRLLSFRLLRVIVDMIEKNSSAFNPENSLEHYYHERDGYVNMLINHLSHQSELSNTEQNLLFHCNNYMNAKKRSWL